MHHRQTVFGLESVPAGDLLSLPNSSLEFTVLQTDLALEEGVNLIVHGTTFERLILELLCLWSLFLRPLQACLVVHELQLLLLL